MKRKFLALLCFCALGVSGQAATIPWLYKWVYRPSPVPVIDASNKVKNAIKRVENILKQSSLVTNLATMGKSLAEAQKLYKNVEQVRKNIGQYKGMINRLTQVKDWKRSLIGKSLTLDNFGQASRRWGIEPDKNSAISRLNDNLFGPDSELKQLDRAVGKNMRDLNNLSSNSFLRGVFNGSEAVDVSNFSREQRSAGFAAGASRTGLLLTKKSMEMDARVKAVQEASGQAEKALNLSNKSELRAAQLNQIETQGMLVGDMVSHNAMNAEFNANKNMEMRSLNEEKLNALKRREALKALSLSTEGRN